MFSRRKLPQFGALLATLGLAGCGGDSNGPTEPPAVNQPPAISQIAVSESGYRTARLTAKVSDADGLVISAVIDWGDGQTETVTSNFGSISRTHMYSRAQAYTVALNASDDAGASARASRSVTIETPPELCLGIEIIEVCGEVTPDFRNVNIAAKAGDIVLASFVINEGNASITQPLAGGFGSLTTSFNFTTGRLRLQGQLCAVPFLICDTVFDEFIQF